MKKKEKVKMLKSKLKKKFKSIEKKRNKNINNRFKKLKINFRFLVHKMIKMKFRDIFKKN